MPLLALLPTAHAHNGQISTLSLSRQGSVWTLSLSASITAFNYELEAENPGLNLKELTPQELISLLMKRVSSTIEIAANGTHQVKLVNGAIHPGHQTDILYELEGMPDSLQALSLSLHSFSHNPNHSCVFLLEPTVGNNRFILTQGNNFTVSLQRKNATVFEPVKTNRVSVIPWLAILGLLIMVFFVWWVKH